MTAKRENASWCGDTRNYTSGMIHSKTQFFYGKAEIRAKIPYGMGFWPAFWFYGSGANEIDVFEFGCQDPYEMNTNIRKSINGNIEDWLTSWNTSWNLSSGFYIYILEWDPNEIKISVNNGNVVRTIYKYYTTNFGALHCNTSYSTGVYFLNSLFPGNPLNIIINLAIGSSSTPFTGSPNSNTIFPNTFEIDYIRVYQRNPSNGYYDLCNNRGISGSTLICSGQKSYSFSGYYNNLVWSVSPNLIIDNINGNTITVHPVSATVNGTGWIKASDDTPCSQMNFTKNIWIGKPNIPIVGDNVLEVRFNGYAELNYPPGAVNGVVWSKSGALASITGTNTSAIYRAASYPGNGVVYANINNACGSSSQYLNVNIIDPQYRVYPNPNTGEFKLEIVNPNFKSGELVIYNPSGKSQVQQVHYGMNSIKLSGSEKGLFYLNVLNDKTVVFSYQLIVK